MAALGHVLRFLWLLACMLLVSVLPGQQAIMQSWTLRDGLAGGRVRALHIDTDGFIWIATLNGLSRFDGRTFKNYSKSNGLSHNVINDVYSISSDTVYVAQNDGTVDAICHGAIVPAKRMKAAIINSFGLSCGERTLVAGDNFGIGMFGSDTLIQLTSLDVKRHYSCLIQVGSFTIATGISGIATTVFDQDFRQVQAWREPGLEAYTLFGYSRDTILMGTNRGLYHIVLNRDSTLHLVEHAGKFREILPARAAVRAIQKTSDGNIWFATELGLIVTDADGEARFLTQNDGLPDNDITALAEDHSQSLWIGTGQGIARIDLKTRIDVFTTTNGLIVPIVNSVATSADGKVLLINGYAGVCTVAGNRVERNEHPAFDISGGVFQLVRTDSDILVSTQRGIYTTDGVLKFEAETVAQWSSGFTIRSKDIIIYAGPTGLVSCKDQCIVDTSFGFQVTSSAELQDGSILLGTWGSGLYLLTFNEDLGQAEWSKYETQPPDLSVRSLAVASRGDIWVGTRYSGLFRIRVNASKEEKKVRAYDQNSGLMSDWVTSVAEDQDGSIWVGMDLGLDKLVASDTGYVIFPFAKTFDFYPNVLDLSISKDGTLWGGAMGGLFHIRDGHREHDSPHHVLLTDVMIGDSEYQIPESDLVGVTAYNRNAASFTFASPHSLNSRQDLYQYRLIGSHDTSWSVPAHNGEVSFANLQPGAYSFQVRQWLWNQQGGPSTHQSFVVLKPFWRKPWFIGLLSMAIIFGIITVYRFQVRQMRSVFRVRERIAADLHDEIGSSLTHVGILAEIAGRQGGNNNQTGQFLRRIGEEVQASSESLDDIIWSVKTSNDSPEDLVARVRRFGSELFEGETTSFRILDEDFSSAQKLGMEIKNDLFLIIKELIRNVARHAQAKTVTLILQREGQVIRIIVEDDGIGLNPEPSSDRSGLQNVRRRATRWGGQVEIDSTAGRGTRVSAILNEPRRLIG